MKRKVVWMGCAVALVLMMALPGMASDTVIERTAAVMTYPQNTGVHYNYMNGDDEGLFEPDRKVTRAELAQMLSALVADLPESEPRFEDVAQDAWYAPAVAKTAGLGMMGSSSRAMFRPEEAASRAECAAALSMLLPYDVEITQAFPDVDRSHWAWEAIGRTASVGLFVGDDQGLFRPDDGLLRCEAVAVFNRLLGRRADVNYLANSQNTLRTFPDVSPDHWAYADIMEAAVAHECGILDRNEIWYRAGGGLDTTIAADIGSEVTAEPEAPAGDSAEQEAGGLPDGPVRLDGRLYWVQGGEFIRDQSVSGLYFDAEGRYTTGDEALDEKLNSIVEELTDESMTRDEKLRVLFDYIRDNYTYLKRPLISKGQTGWEPEYASFFLANGKGNCYSFSAAYCLLCRELGLPAYTVVGSALNSAHGWVEIVLDGEVWMFDTQLEWRYLHDWGKSGYDFFKMPVNNTPVKYTWA